MINNFSSASKVLQPTFRKVVICLIVFSALALTQQVVLGLGWTVSKTNFLSGVTAKGFVEVYPYEQGGIACRVKSYTNPATTINIIGWTWWQCDFLNSNNQVISSVARGARTVTASSTEETIYRYPISGNPAKFKTSGVHDFNHTGANPSPWRPYNSIVWTP